MKENISPNIWHRVDAKHSLNIVLSDLHNSGRFGLVLAPFLDEETEA